jgi:chemotaxis protein MotA
MFVIIGYIVALGCIFGGFIIHGGNIGVVLAALPIETMVIAGGALGAFSMMASGKLIDHEVEILLDQ